MDSPQIAAKAMDDPNLWLPKGLAKPTANWILFCLPFAGGNAQYYRNWQELLPQWLELCPLQPPGRGERLRHKALETITDMAHEASLAVQLKIKPGKKIAIFGHSMGSLLAFETTKALLKKGVSVEYLFISGYNAPHIKRKQYDIHDKPDDFVLNSLKDYGGTSKEMLASPDMRELYLPTVRADFKALETYRCKDKTAFDIPLLVTYGEKDDAVSTSSIKQWKNYTTNFFELIKMPGEHFYLTDERKTLVREIVERLANATIFA